MVKPKSPPDREWSVVKMISTGRVQAIERASESESSDYENCSSSDDSLWIDVGHLPLKTYYYDACN